MISSNTIRWEFQKFSAVDKKIPCGVCQIPGRPGAGNSSQAIAAVTQNQI
jgi:hypothetical protein